MKVSFKRFLVAIIVSRSPFYLFLVLSSLLKCSIMRSNILSASIRSLSFFIISVNLSLNYWMRWFLDSSLISIIPIELEIPSVDESFFYLLLLLELTLFLKLVLWRYSLRVKFFSLFWFRVFIYFIIILEKQTIS